ncbi:hypothetical protein N7454_001499 [Penicillium verhagenii]|nr:hypothetical protein N7454_001499 [Penicillium verhagenii]
MFALASLIFHLEHGFPPQLSLENGRLTLPELKSGKSCIDEAIQAAWLGNYKRTSDMVNHLSSIDTNHHAENPEALSDLEILKNEVVTWTNYRKRKFGMAVPYWGHKTTSDLQIKPAKSFSGCVIEGILSEEQLQNLAAQYDIDPNADLRFSHDSLRLTNI